LSPEALEELSSRLAGSAHVVQVADPTLLATLASQMNRRIINPGDGFLLCLPDIGAQSGRRAAWWQFSSLMGKKLRRPLPSALTSEVQRRAAPCWTSKLEISRQRWRTLHTGLGGELSGTIPQMEELVAQSVEDAASIELPTELDEEVLHDPDAAAQITDDALLAEVEAHDEESVVENKEAGGLASGLPIELEAVPPDRAQTSSTMFLVCAPDAAPGLEVPVLPDSPPVETPYLAARQRDGEPPFALSPERTLESQAYEVLQRQTCGHPWFDERVLMVLYGYPPDGRASAFSQYQVEKAIGEVISRLELPGGPLTSVLSDAHVQRVVESLLIGAVCKADRAEREQLIQLGLVAVEPHLRFSCPIVESMVWRHLTDELLSNFSDRLERFLDDEGHLGLEKLLRRFQSFCRHEYDKLRKSMQYQKASPVLVFLAYLRQTVGVDLVQPHFAAGFNEFHVMLILSDRRYLVLVKRAKAPADIVDGLETLDFELQQNGTAEGALLTYDPRVAVRQEERYCYEKLVMFAGRHIVLFGI